MSIFMIQDCNEWKHVRLVWGFVQACYQRGATMAAKDGTGLCETESFCFSIFKAFPESRWGKQSP